MAAAVVEVVPVAADRMPLPSLAGGAKALELALTLMIGLPADVDAWAVLAAEELVGWNTVA